MFSERHTDRQASAVVFLGQGNCTHENPEPLLRRGRARPWPVWASAPVVVRELRIALVKLLSF